MSDSLVTGAIVAGRYRLSKLLGRGGMGEVWGAVHQVTGREVAIKCLKDSAHRDPDARLRFQREARAASAVNHPNVVDVLDFAERDGEQPMIVMEWLEGETLADKLARDGRLSLATTAALLVPAISAVGTAHARGIVHRDLKPSNIFIGASEGKPAVVKVLDFGIAKWATPEEAGSALRTQTGSTLGTPCYMAPEQAIGDRRVDHRADVWAFGVILYECLAGVRPVEGENAAQVVARLMSTGIIPVEELAEQVPGEIATLIRRMLTRDASRRSGDLRDAFVMLSKHTSIDAPEFPEPGQDPTPEAIEPADEDGLPPIVWAPTGSAQVQARAAAATVRLAAEVPKPAAGSALSRLFTAVGFVLAASFLIWLARTRDSAAVQRATEARTSTPAPSVPTPTVRPATSPAPNNLGLQASPRPEASTTLVLNPNDDVKAVRKRSAKSAPPKAAALPLSPTGVPMVAAHGLPTGAACEASPECESRQCVAYACK